MNFHLNIIGSLFIALAFVHIPFPKYFNWNNELKSLSLINKQMMIVHTFFIALTVFLMGLLLLTTSTELTETNLGKKLSLGLGIFWLTRLMFQLFVYSPKHWKGKLFETIVHIVFTIFWTYTSAVFLIIYFE